MAFLPLGGVLRGLKIPFSELLGIFPVRIQVYFISLGICRALQVHGCDVRQVRLAINPCAA